MKKALIVGIGNIESAPLSGTSKDAVKVESSIATNGDGSPNFNVKLITDDENDVTKSDLNGLLKDLFEGEDDIALFYFSGHGFLDNTGGYIVTSDYAKNDEGIPMDKILSLANNSKIKNKIIILDCCHSGQFGSSPIIGENKSIINKGVTILTASRENQSAIETSDGGIFTNLLIQALNGGASDIRGEITPSSVYAYIDQALGAWEQRPMFKTNVSEFASLRKIEPSISLNVLRKLIEYFEFPEDEYNLNPSYEDTNSEKIEHEIIKPYAKKENIDIFKNLQKMESVGLIVPNEEEHMYFAAMNSKSCRLTALGHHYWRLVKNKKI